MFSGPPSTRAGSITAPPARNQSRGRRRLSVAPSSAQAARSVLVRQLAPRPVVARRVTAARAALGAQDPARRARHRPRPLHGRRAGAPRRQLEEAAAVHPRRARAGAGPRPGRGASLRPGARLPLVREGRLLHPQPARRQRRDRGRGRAAARRGALAATRADGARQRRAEREREKAEAAGDRRLPSREPPAEGARRRAAPAVRAELRARRLLPALQVRSRAATRWPARRC